MRWFAQIATALVYSNIWVSVGAALLTAQSYWLSRSPVNQGVVVFVFFSTLATYNFQRLVRFNVWGYRSNLRRVNWILQSKRDLSGLTSISLIIAGGVAFVYLELRHILVLVPLGIISLLYAYPVVPSAKKRLALRDMPGLKIIWIAASWAGVTAVLPLVGVSVSPQSWWLLVAERFFFILAITIPFDIRDLNYDKPNQKTIPQLVGIRAAGGIALLFMLLFIAAVLVNKILGFYSDYNALALGALGLITAFVLMFSFRKRKEPYYSGLLDGLTILQPIMVYLSFR